MNNKRSALLLPAFTASCVAVMTLLGSSDADGARINCFGERPPGAPEPDALSFDLQEVKGRRIVVMAGAIREGDGRRLARFISTAGRIDEIWLDSGGGDAAEGMPIGRAIRQKGLATRVPNGFKCISSCTFAFMGGIVRRIDPGADYGVHMFYMRSFLDQLAAINQREYEDLKGKPGEKEQTRLRRERDMRDFLHAKEQDNAKLAAAWQQYVQEMGISRDFLLEVVLPQLSLKFEVDERNRVRPTGSHRCLTAAEQLRYNIVNTTQ